MVGARKIICDFVVPIVSLKVFSQPETITK